ncbi:MAG: hypothetical protein IKO84_00520 [Butyrivibrio sp.]|nr:hypothetical protein [Butyrivibrio sp.]
MKLREKWEKQNNSIKLLLRKLKRHDTRVVAAAVVIATILCGGLIYISTPVVTANAQEKFEESERESKEATTQKLDELHDFLTEIDKGISDNNDTIKSFSDKKTDDESDKYKNIVNEKAGALSGNLNTIHDNISDTQSRIDSLKEMIDAGNKADKEKIASEFAQVNTELEKLNKDYQDTKNKTTDLMDEIKKAVNSGNDSISKESLAQYEELLKKLSSFNSDMEENSKDLLSKSEIKFDELASKISDLEDELDKRNKEAIESNEKGFTEITNNFDQQFNDYGSKVTTDINGVKEYINTKTTEVNDKLDQVFWRVSNGKKLLASALLTKGVKINEDATFTEFAKAIQNIPQKMVLDSGETAAEIVYEYHYHKDGKGRTVNANLVSAAYKGGCYNTPVYHRHTDSCYKTVDEYLITTKKSVVDRGWVKDDPDGGANNRYRCNHCGAEFVSNNERHYERVYSMQEVIDREGKVMEVNQKRVLSCNKQDGQLEGYAPNCGFAHGQVASAHLKFQGKNAKYNTSVAAINTSNAVSTANLRSTRSLNILSLVGADFGRGDDADDTDEEKDNAQSRAPVAPSEAVSISTAVSGDENNSQDNSGHDTDGDGGTNENSISKDIAPSEPTNDTMSVSTFASSSEELPENAEATDDSSPSTVDASGNSDSSGSSVDANVTEPTASPHENDEAHDESTGD